MATTTEGYLSESRAAAVLSHRPEALEIVKASERGWTRGGSTAMLENMLQTQSKLYAQGRVPAYDVAATSALLGRRQAALEYLQRAYDRHESALLDLRIDPRFRNLHNEPAYLELLKRIGLPPLS